MLKIGFRYLKDFIFNRVTEIHEKVLSRDREYKDLEKEYRIFLHQLLERLGSDGRGEFFDYENAETGLVSRGEQLIYWQGLLDGIRLGDWVEQVRKGKYNKTTI